MRKDKVRDRKCRNRAKILSIIIFFTFGLLCFAGCLNGDNHKSEKAEEKKETTVSATNDECTEICSSYKDKKRSLCLRICRPSLSPETMRLKHSSEMDGLLTCDNAKIKAAVENLINIKESSGGKDFLPSHISLEDWPVCSMPFWYRTISDKIYWDVVKYGLLAIPCLIEKTQDNSLTQADIPYFSDRFGRLRTGDVAFIAIMDMVQRSDKDIYAIFDGDVHVDGFYAYYEFVRNDSNRILLSERLNQWWEAENRNLIWIKAPCHYTGGFWTSEKHFKEMIETTAGSFFK